MWATSGTERARKSRLHNLLKGTAVAIILGGTIGSEPFLTRAFAQEYSFSAISVEGNARVDTATVLSFAGIARGAVLSAGALNDVYRRLMAAGLFETVELIPQGDTLVIRVTEYPMINIVDFQGNKRLKDAILAAAVTSQTRHVYSPSQADADAAAITELYAAKGRLAATVTPRIIRRDNNRVDLVFEITEGKVVEVEKISFVGNRAFTDRRLRQVLQTKQAGILHELVQRDTFVAERLDLDKQLLRDFYLSRGYADVEILDTTGELSRERDASFITFTLREGQQYSVGKLSTVSEIEGVDAAEFEAVQRIRSGETYTPQLIENNIIRMEALVARKGLNFVRIDPQVTRNAADGTIDVAFVLTRGERMFVERIDIEGNTTTLDQVVRRQFATVEGDAFNAREIRKAAERIRALGYFSDAQVDAKPGSSADQMVVDVNVVEAPTGSLSFGASYGINSGLGFNFGFSETNFLGRGQSLTLNITTGTDTADSNFSFVEPAFLGRNVKFKLDAAYSESTQADEFYDTRNIMFSPALEFPISTYGRLELRYTASMDQLSNVSAASSPILANEEAMGDLLSSGLGYSYSYDTRNTDLNPKGGVLLRFSQDFAGLGGDIESITTSAMALAETKVMHEEVTLRTIFEGGMISSLGGNPSRVTERFFGNGKIRGFEPNGIGPRDMGATNKDALGGNMFAVARFEADFPLGLPEEYGINGGLFLDVGSVWGLDTTAGGIDVQSEDFRLRSAAGLSLFWKTPVGPLRFNFSRPLIKEDFDREQNFDLTVSTTF